MKVELAFSDGPIIPYADLPDRSEIIKVNKGIAKKVYGKIVDFPCVPTRKMHVDILSFANTLGFTKQECTLIDGWGSIFEIDYIVIRSSHIQVWLKYG